MVAESELLFRLIAAALIGLVLGMEREIRRKPAGMRTHALVCMGSCLFTLVSLTMSGNNVDVSRIASGVVTGIGFLGAGTIFFNKDKIHGLTTAAEMWALAAIGLAVGIGMYYAAVVAAAIVMLILLPGKKLEETWFRR